MEAATVVGWEEVEKSLEWEEDEKSFEWETGLGKLLLLYQKLGRRLVCTRPWEEVEKSLEREEVEKRLE